MRRRNTNIKGRKRRREKRRFRLWLGREGRRQFGIHNREEDIQMVDPFPKYGLEKRQGEYGGLVCAD